MMVVMTEKVLEKELAEVTNQTELVRPLANILLEIAENNQISYREVEEIANDKAKDALLLGSELGLINSVRRSKCVEWGGRNLLVERGEAYESPNFVKHLVGDGIKSSQWDLERTISKAFKEIEDPNWDKIPKLVKEIERESENNMVNADQIKQICVRLELDDRVGALIAELKGMGIITPKLNSCARLSDSGSPFYKVNPILEKMFN